jgi:hypothetical protein
MTELLANGTVVLDERRNTKAGARRFAIPNAQVVADPLAG